MSNLPIEWETFYYEMCNKGRRFIEINYWSIPESTFNSWLSNFQEDEEKFLAALLIYRITFRNKDSKLSLFREATDIIIPNFLKNNGLMDIVSIEDFYNSLEFYPYALPFRFATIEGIDRKTGKSGTSLLRDLYRDAEYHKELNISPDLFSSLPSNIKLIIILDDFLGTSGSFKKYAEKYIEPNKDRLQFIYIPLAAYEEGLRQAETDYPYVIIYPIEILGENDSFFTEKILPDFVLESGFTIDDIKNIYIKIMKSKTKLEEKDFFGFGEKSLTHCFDDSSPNNILPIYWYHSENWHRLFTR